ncbi:Protease inhibitor Inh [Microvirga guangxiensis]|uniref:Protease inhibitor Inh n=1 Tax=Microvirga guangxiensis TaxID=549386 RepID=A0A1G5CU76_9HYPH|nr:Protease inhibitor Inh [Microvirga guangxiensis]
MKILLQSAPPILSLFAIALLTGCNSQQGTYSQGPWGRHGADRNYPEYSAPWGRRIAEARVSMETVNTDPPAIIVGPSPTARHYGQVAGLPEDPQPSSVMREDTPPVAVNPTIARPRNETQHNDSAHAPVADSPPGVFSAPRRAASYAGTWQAKDEKGRTCLIHLSNVSALDLYKASTSKCSDEVLRQVNMWHFEGSRVSLFSRGTETARLEGTEASLTGALSQSGTSIKMVR